MYCCALPSGVLPVDRREAQELGKYESVPRSIRPASGHDGMVRQANTPIEVRDGCGITSAKLGIVTSLVKSPGAPFI